MARDDWRDDTESEHVLERRGPSAFTPKPTERDPTSRHHLGLTRLHIPPPSEGRARVLIAGILVLKTEFIDPMGYGRVLIEGEVWVEHASLLHIVREGSDPIDVCELVHSFCWGTIPSGLRECSVRDRIAIKCEVGFDAGLGRRRNWIHPRAALRGKRATTDELEAMRRDR